MTIDNCTTNQELLNAIKDINIRPDVLDRFLKNHHPQLHQELVNRTKFLDEGFFKGKPVPILARLHCLEHNLSSSPICSNPSCNNPVEWRNGSHIFAPYCCRQCYLDDPDSHRKEEQTKLLKYGNPYYSNPEKRVRNAMAKWGTDNYCNRRKSKETCQRKYNGNAPACSPEIVEKMKVTKKERYGDSGYNNHEKAVRTCEARYGVRNVSQIEGVQDKVKRTNNERYGALHITQTEEGMNRIRNTNLARYHVTHYNQSEEYRKRLPEIRRKMCKKWLLLWNDDALKEHLVTRDRANISNWSNCIQFDSEWEVKVWLFLKERGFEFEYQPNLTLDYEYDGRTHVYHPDFLVNGRLFEVKGDNFFRINEETGKEEMFMPWRYPHWSDEKYAWFCGREEAKHQCMLRNNVRILRGIDMENLSDGMFARIV